MALPAVEVYDPEQWSNFFVLVGSGSAALTGLVFVAITINLKGVAQDATHRYRAINMLSGFTSILVVSSFALMGHQTYRTLGIEVTSYHPISFLLIRSSPQTRRTISPAIWRSCQPRVTSRRSACP